jgi:hypothetical protein
MTQFQVGTAGPNARFPAAGGTIKLKDLTMNSIVRLGFAAVFAIGGASAVIAQDTTGSIGGSFDTLMMTLEGASSVDLAAVTEETTINFVTVSSLTDADPAALDTALQADAEEMTTLHASIEGNEALKGKIEAGGFAVDNIIAVEAAADGSYTFYVDDRA